MYKSVKHTIGKHEIWIRENTKRFIPTNAFKYLSQLPTQQRNLNVQMTIIEDGTNTRRMITEHGILHRLDGPAITLDSGDQYWIINGKRHRTDGPAVITFEQTRLLQSYNCIRYDEWYQNGKLHRLDGPAVVRHLDDRRSHHTYWINGTQYDFVAEYDRAVKHWLSYRDITRQEIEDCIGKFRIVEWD